MFFLKRIVRTKLDLYIVLFYDLHYTLDLWSSSYIYSASSAQSQLNGKEIKTTRHITYLRGCIQCNVLNILVLFMCLWRFNID